MNSNEIKILIDQFGISNFLGVFAIDELKEISENSNGVLIFNTDPSYKSGQHWIATCICNQDIFYFDPLAEIEKSPTEILSFAKRQKKNFTYNNIRVQSYDSSSCGLHCLVFCYVMSKRPVFTIYKRYLKSFLSCKSIEEREKLSTSYFSIIKKRKSTHKTLE